MLTLERVATKKDITPLYAEGINMMERLVNEEVDQCLEENPKMEVSM